jgi:hypothetical protein
LIAAKPAPGEPGVSQAALVAAPRVVLTGTQVSYGYQEADSRLALGRLIKALEQAAPKRATWHS